MSREDRDVVDEERTGCPVHHVSGALIRAEEQQLGFGIQVDYGVLDTWCGSGNKEINNSVYVFLEAETR